MKALTIWQPWASLLVSGQKKYETRSWATAYRGIVGKAILTRCNLITEDFRAKLSPQELDLGDFSIGRYAWEFHMMVPVDPPVKTPGKQGLWTWEE